jgi:hypothetical protein
VQNRARDGWHAGADNTDIGFHAAPESDFVVVVCRIAVLSNLRDVLQTDNAADCDEQADEKDEHNSNLSSRVFDLQFHQPGHRKEEHDKIESNVQTATSVDSQREIDAMSFMFSIP